MTSQIETEESYDQLLACVMLKGYSQIEVSSSYGISE